MYEGKLILYGCGDLLDDYEGISGDEAFRGDLGLLYFAALEADRGHLVHLELVPTAVRRFRVERAAREEAQWLMEALNAEGGRWGTQARLTEEGRFALTWDRGGGRHAGRAGAPPHP